MVSEWVCTDLKFHSTLYRSFRRRFLQVRWFNQQHQNTEESQLATEIRLWSHHNHATVLQYEQQATASRLITAWGPQCDKNPICWTYKLPRTSCNKSVTQYYSNYSSCVDVPSLLQTIVTNQMRPCTCTTTVVQPWLYHTKLPWLYHGWTMTGRTMVYFVWYVCTMMVPSTVEPGFIIVETCYKNNRLCCRTPILVNLDKSPEVDECFSKSG